MGANPQRRAEQEFGAEAPGVPGHPVDLLVSQGRVNEARAELERLLVEGVESGSGRLMTEDLLDEIVAKARSRARRVAG
jgi:hypothetical protein